MPVNRRQFLRSAAVVAPAIILTPGLLMPVRTLSAAPVMAGFCKYEGFTFIETITAAPIVTQRLDLMDAPWQILSVARANGKIWDFVELSELLPDLARLDKHSKIASEAFKRAARRDS